MSKFSKTSSKNPVLITLTALTALGLGSVAFAQADAAQARTVQQSALRPAVSGELRELRLPGFGTVRYYASDSGSASGSGTGRPLILTHAVNAAASSYELKPIWDMYAGQRPVYALEWPGFGQSDRPDIRYTPELMAQALTALVDELGTEVDVVSLSLGSEFAARAAQKEPRIRSLALISPSGLGEARGPSQSAQKDQRSQQTYQNLSRWEDPLFATIRSRPSIQYFLSRSFRGPVPNDLVQYAWETSRQAGASNAPLYFLSGQLFDQQAFDQLYAPLTIPVAVLFDKDGFVSFERLPELEAKPNVAAVRIAGTDGMPQWEQPAAVRQVLEEFWAQVK